MKIYDVGVVKKGGLFKRAKREEEERDKYLPLVGDIERICSVKVLMSSSVNPKYLMTMSMDQSGRPYNYHHASIKNIARFPNSKVSELVSLVCGVCDMCVFGLEFNLFTPG